MVEGLLHVQVVRLLVSWTQVRKGLRPWHVLRAFTLVLPSAKLVGAEVPVLVLRLVEY